MHGVQQPAVRGVATGSNKEEHTSTTNTLVGRCASCIQLALAFQSNGSACESDAVTPSRRPSATAPLVESVDELAHFEVLVIL